MKIVQLFLVLFSLQFTTPFIIPDEVPSLLSVIYSNIPTIKKGTDSRLGWGFRLGDRADFQVLVELGPQTYTQPLANQGSNANKRDALNTLSNTLYAQRQRDKQEKKKDETISESEGGKWLSQWKDSMQKRPEEVKGKPGIGIGEIDAKSVIPDDAKKVVEKTKEKALDDVDLD